MKLLAIDVGGTAIKSAIIHKGEISQLNIIQSDGNLGREYLLRNIFKCISGYNDFRAIGISTTGLVDSDNGIVTASKNVPNYAGTKLKEIMEEACHVPVYVENDVNAAAIGEAHYGVCKNQTNFLCLTYGTGIGGAIILNRKIYKGSAGFAGEVGHIITHSGGKECTCGNKGCYEQYASTTALVRMVNDIYPTLKDGKMIFENLNNKGSKELHPIINQWIQEIVYGLVSLTHIFNPSCIVLGGGIMNQQYILPRIKKLFYKQVMESYHNVSIKTAKMENNAGIYGMAAIASMEGVPSITGRKRSCKN